MKCVRRSLLQFCFLFIASATCFEVARSEELRAEEFRPQWQVGQQWEIETTFLQSQARKDPNASSSRPVRWRFEVMAVDEIEGKQCFRVVVRCLEPGEHPETTLWVEQNSLTLQRIRMQLPGPDGFSTATEDYRSASGQPFPTVSALTVPPLDLPLFLSGTKGTELFEYRASVAPEGAKEVGEIDFAISIEQQLIQPTDEDLQQWLPQQFAKSAEKKAVIEVRLKTGRSQVRQLWQRGVPWPIYSDNGVAVSRLQIDNPPPNEPNDPDQGANR